MMTYRTFTRLPSIQNGYELDDQFSVVVPIARTNLVINPSFETNTTSWTAIGGSIARTTTQQYHGAYSLAITPTAATTDGARFDTVSLIGSTLYAYSAKVLGIAGRAYKLAIETTAGVELSSVTFIASGRWQWITGYWNENTTTTRRVTIRKAGGTDTLVFYLDGVQVEAIAAGETASTYLDGDQLGFVPNQSPIPYYWNGTPHASTSARSGLTRAGGMVVKFKDFGFLLTAIVGLGLAAPANIVTEYARIDGGYDSYTRKPTRQFTLSGQFQGGLDYLQLRQYRGGLSRLLDRDLIGQDQRLLIRREVVDPCGGVQSSVCRVIGKYQGGLSGNTDNQTAEQAALTFTQYMPNVLADGESGGALAVQTSVANANAVMKRSPGGVWSALSSGLGGVGADGVHALLSHPNGTVYVGGNYTSAGATSADMLSIYNPQTDSFAVAVTATTFNNTVLSLAVDPAGNVYVGGKFINAGSASGDGVVKYDPVANTVASLGSGFPGFVYVLATDSSGRVFAGGDSGTLFGGVANTNAIGYWNGSTWVAMGTGTSTGNVYALLCVGTRVYAGGSFTSMGGVANTNRLAYYDFADNLWHSVTSGATDSDVQSIIRLSNGQLLFGGRFATIGGVATGGQALYNGTSFQAIGGNGALSIGTVFTQVALTTGQVVLGGTFTNINGVPYYNVAMLSGNTYTFIDVIPPAVGNTFALTQSIDGSLYIGFDQVGTATATGLTTITNPGTARSYPTIVINGPSSGTARIHSITNATTGRAIYLNLVLNVGEVATLVFMPDNLSFTSTFQGNIAGSILPGSNTADFFLQPGANSIAFLSAGSSVVATLYFRPAFLSLDDVP